MLSVIALDKSFCSNVRVVNDRNWSCIKPR